MLAVEGSYASVIGGAPAAAVVFAGDVAARTEADPRVADLQARLADADEREQARLRAELDDVRAAVRSEKLGEVAAEFDAIHSVERARGSARSTRSSRRRAAPATSSTPSNAVCGTGPAPERRRSQRAASPNRSRAITSRWISLVPS